MDGEKPAEPSRCKHANDPGAPPPGFGQKHPTGVLVWDRRLNGTWSQPGRRVWLPSRREDQSVPTKWAVLPRASVTLEMLAAAQSRGSQPRVCVGMSWRCVTLPGPGHTPNQFSQNLGVDPSCEFLNLPSWLH